MDSVTEHSTVIPAVRSLKRDFKFKAPSTMWEMFVSKQEDTDNANRQMNLTIEGLVLYQYALTVLSEWFSGSFV